MKKSFLIFSDCLPAVETLGDAAAGVLFKMLLRYSETGEKPDNIPTILQFPFMSFVAQIERNRDKYLAVCEKRKEAIKKRWSKEKSIQMNTNEYKRTQVNTSDTDSDSKSVSDSDSGNISNLSVTMDSSLSSPIVEDNIIESKASTSSDDDAKLVLTPQEGGGKRVKDYSENVMRFWNHTMISPVAIPTIAKMTPKRKSMVNARVKEFGINMVYNAIAKASESSFLNGGGSKGFIADFDWVFRPNNFPKVLEGNYDDVKPNNVNGNGNTNGQQKSREQREADLLAKERLDYLATKYGDIG